MTKTLHKNKIKLNKGANKLTVYGDDLKPAGGVTVTAALKTNLSAKYSLSVDNNPVKPKKDRVDIDATLTPRSSGQRDDSGDLTITLTYSDDPTPLEVTWTEVIFSPDAPP